MSSAHRFSIDATASNHFAWLNTRLALERTFMAWIRTAVSLISFGFTIVQFFQRFTQTENPGSRPFNPGAPRILGLALIGVGILALAISSWQYRQGIDYLWQTQFRAIAGIAEKPLRSPVFLSAIVLLLMIFATFNDIVHLATS